MYRIIRKGFDDSNLRHLEVRNDFLKYWVLGKVISKCLFF